MLRVCFEKKVVVVVVRNNSFFLSLAGTRKVREKRFLFAFFHIKTSNRREKDINKLISFISKRE